MTSINGTRKTKLMSRLSGPRDCCVFLVEKFSE